MAPLPFKVSFFVDNSKPFIILIDKMAAIILKLLNAQSFHSLHFITYKHSIYFYYVFTLTTMKIILVLLQQKKLTLSRSLMKTIQFSYCINFSFIFPHYLNHHKRITYKKFSLIIFWDLIYVYMSMIKIHRVPNPQVFFL